MKFNIFGKTFSVRDTPKVQSFDNVDKKKSKSADIYHNYVPMKTQIQRISRDVGDYKTAVIAAENWLNPQRYLLYQVYRNIEIDAHLTAVLQQRKNLTLCKKFHIVNANGVEQKDKFNILTSTWFRDFLNYSLDSIPWGHSLIQFGDIVNNSFTSVELIPRQFVKPELHIVAENWTCMVGNDYLAEPFKDWCISVGGDKDLGLYLKAAPLIIWKQAAMGAWAEYQEVFGSPLRYLKTNVLDYATKQSGIDMMENMSSASWAVIDKDDELVITQQSRNDAYKVYDEMVNRVNSEISKLFLGQTGTTDEKAFVGSAEVQERTLSTFADNDEAFILSLINDKLIPFLKNLGINIGEGNRITVAEGEALDAEKKSKLMVDLINTGKYKATTDYIKETFALELEEVEEQEPEEDQEAKVKKKLNDLYS